MQAMAAGLLGLLERDERPPCADGSGRWISESRADRIVAAGLCQSCTLLEVCGAYADEVSARFGVWAGTDRTQSAWSRAP